MKKRFFNISLCFCFALIICFALSGCGVTPCAWVKLDMEGYVYITSYVYAGHGHIYLYEDEETFQADEYHTDYKIMIEFYPRCLSHDVDDWDVALVDIGDRYYSMQVYINKSNLPNYNNMKMYLNDTALTPTTIYGAEEDNPLYGLYYENFTFVRGNPNGQENGFVNKLVYKV